MKYMMKHRMQRKIQTLLILTKTHLKKTLKLLGFYYFPYPGTNPTQTYHDFIEVIKGPFFKYLEVLGHPGSMQVRR